MRNHPRTARLAMLLCTLAVASDAATAPIGALLDRVNARLLAPDRTPGQAKEGLDSLLSAIATVSASVDLPAEFAAKLAAARTSEPGARTGSLLAECYRLAHGGAAFRMPESVDSIEAAVDHARRRLAAARGLVEKGQSRDGLRALLEVAMVVVTPMESHGH